jgi:hypothetical protein
MTHKEKEKNKKEPIKRTHKKKIITEKAVKGREKEKKKVLI